MNIWIDKDTKLRVNVYGVSHEHPYKGFSKLDTPEIRERAGLIEIPEPTPPEDYSEDTHYKTEQNEAPYVIYTKKPDEQIQQIRWNKIKTKRDDLQVAGCPVGEYWIHNDVKSRGQWERMANRCEKLALADSDPYQIGGLQVPWKTMSGAKVPLTAGFIRQVMDTFEVREAMIFAHAETLKADIDADIDAGWPERYEAAA